MLKSTVISPSKGLKGEREFSVKFKVNHVSRGFSSTSYASTQGKPQLEPEGDTFKNLMSSRNRRRTSMISDFIYSSC